jgi:hypothetical protein
MNTTIKFPSEEEKRALLKKVLQDLKVVRQERQALVLPAARALNRLVDCCAHKTGQGYKVRALLFSLWNGKPVSLADKLALDWELQKDFSAVLLAFGHDDFFYDAFKNAFKRAGLFDWFTAEGGQE